MADSKTVKRRKMEPSVLVGRTSRSSYHIGTQYFLPEGLANVGDVQNARQLAALLRAHELTIRAGDLHAIGLIQSITRFLVSHYSTMPEESGLAASLSFISEKIADPERDVAFHAMVHSFPPLSVYEGKQTVDDFASGEAAVILENLLVWGLANENPAMEPFSFLHQESHLESYASVADLWRSLQEYLATVIVPMPEGTGERMSLLDALRAPVRESPDSLLGQLAYLRNFWGAELGVALDRLLRGMDFLQEENKIRFDPGFGPGPSVAPALDGMDDEPERFSKDLDWMPRVVMIAKSTYVWLDQLSKAYARPISTLDQIPDQELDRLEAWGFTALWLIGLWERSRASERIKQRMGNPEAAASAYSLYDSVLADDLGGYAAYENLRDRCWQRGIRLACDMVPNHTGIDGRWVIEHPEWFVQVDQPPFPSYSFGGPDLCDHRDVGIFLEDHYYDHSDASVVFKRLDYRSGDARYIYHGNDGTSLPWNDTAQINFLNPEARNAVADSIIAVARQFPIIRLDAAMVLAKRHIQRLWFPEPGQGGDIASRSEHGLSKDDFDRAIPEEFWREVVDRVAIEAPDTLLLAEAFWMLEGYFVRTLGMHRVYNSAFMNMLKNEENSEYREVIKKTLEFDPEVLKRYVNFLNNPDEKTAVEQFGKGDKYFGVAMMMVTLPGLPMFGHGQVEGFSEKYGMEYRKAYYDESEDPYLIERHEREIFPVARKRYLFANADHFRLYDFYGSDGNVNENVFAYSNRHHHERALVIYNNAYERASGVIKVSAAFSRKEGEDRKLVQESLADGLQLRDQERYFTILRDHISGLEFIRSNHDLRAGGLFVELGGYQYQVFTQIREVHDTAGYYRRLHDHLVGRGVPNVEEAIKEFQLQPLHDPFGALMHLVIHYVLGQAAEQEFESTFKTSFEHALRVAAEWTGNGVDFGGITQLSLRAIEIVKSLQVLPQEQSSESMVSYVEREHQAVLCAWSVVHPIGYLISHTGKNVGPKARNLIEAWLLDRVMKQVFEQHGFDMDASLHITSLVDVLVSLQNWYEPDNKPEDARPVLTELMQDPEAQLLIQLHSYQGLEYFLKEAFEYVADWLGAVAEIKLRMSTENDPDERDLQTVKALIRDMKQRAETAGYRRDLLDSTENSTPETDETTPSGETPTTPVS